MPPLVQVDQLVVEYRTSKGTLRAVDQVSLSIEKGGTVGLVGESGSGKSTLGRAIVGLVPATAGRVVLDGQQVSYRSRSELRRLRKRVQIVFQDPYSSLNPRMTVAATLEEAVAAHFGGGSSHRSREVNRLLEQVGLSQRDRNLYPFQFSGGQRQRIAIARALAVKPALIVADEITSALDVSVQSTILNLLRELQASTGISYLLISHNLAVARYLADVIAVMHLGQIVEMAPATDIFRHPGHPYTKALIDSVPRLHDRRLERLRLEGDIPDPLRPPPGCRFHTRCPIGPLKHPEREICRTADPRSDVAGPEHFVACHFAYSHDEGVRHPQSVENRT
jgi:oligopeptide/dipeptide ABC transporter ATP-binding protein